MSLYNSYNRQTGEFTSPVISNLIPIKPTPTVEEMQVNTEVLIAMKNIGV